MRAVSKDGAAEALFEPVDGVTDVMREGFDLAPYAGDFLDLGRDVAELSELRLGEHALDGAFHGARGVFDVLPAVVVDELSVDDVGLVRGFAHEVVAFRPMNQAVKVALGAGVLFAGLAYYGRAQAKGDLRVVQVPSTLPADEVVELVDEGHTQPVHAWIAAKVQKGLVVLAGPSGVTEGAILFSVDKATAKELTEDGYFRVIGGSIS